MALTLNEAAKACGRSKGTLSKAIKSGQLSAIRCEDGSFAIEPSELFRVFPGPVVIGGGDRLETPGNTHEIDGLKADLEAARKEAAMFREMLDETRADREDLRKDRDAWRRQAEQQTQLLQDMRAEKPDQTERAGFFGRVWGRR